MSSVRGAIAGLNVQFEKTIAKTERSIRRSEFHGALECLVEAEAMFKMFMLVQDAVAAVREARTQLDLLDSYLGARLRGVSDIELTLLTAQQQLEDGRYRGARIVATLCVEMTAKLLEESPSRDQVAANTRNCIAEQLRLCERMHNVLPRSELVLHVRGLIAGIDRAMADRRMALVTLLIDEVQDLTAGAVAFFSEWDRQSISGDGRSALMGFDRDATDSEFWTNATNRLLSMRLDALARRITGGLMPLDSALPPEPMSA